MKKLISLLLAIIAGMPNIHAQIIEKSTGGMTFSVDISSSSNPVCTLTDGKNFKGEKLIIPDDITIRHRNTDITVPVTIIGEYAFNEKSTITSVKLPYNLIEIGQAAFSNCSGISEIIFPASLTNIRQSAFYKCSKISQLFIPSSVSYIEESAFYKCSALNTVTIEENTSSDIRISANAFSNCPIKVLNCQRNFYNKSTWSSTKSEYSEKEQSPFSDNPFLTTLDLGKSLSYLSEYAFANCVNLSEVNLPSSIVRIKDYAFFNCQSIKNLSFSENSEYIGNHAFEGCSNLKNVTIPKYSLKSIGERAFSKCNLLASISLPNSIDEIGIYAFSNCEGLREIDFGHAVKILPEGIFSECTSISTIAFPSNIRSIGKRAFYNCTKIESLSFDTSNHSPWIGESAFENCIGIKTLCIPSSKKFTSDRTINNYAFRGCINLTEVELYDMDIERESFADCTSLKKVVSKTDGGNLTNNIGRDAFKDCPIETLELHGQNTRNTLPFSNIATIKYLTIGSEVSKLNLDEFKASKNTLTKLILTSSNRGALSISEPFETDTLICLRDKINYIDSHGYPSDEAFGIAKIRKYFSGFANTENAYAGSTLTEANIGWEYARKDIFNSGGGHDSGDFTMSDSDIAKGAFKDCKNLDAVEIAKHTLLISKDAFANSSIKEIVLDPRYYPESLPEIDASTFSQTTYDNAMVYYRTDISGSSIKELDKSVVEESNWRFFKHIYSVSPRGRSSILLHTNESVDIISYLKDKFELNEYKLTYSLTDSSLENIFRGNHLDENVATISEDGIITAKGPESTSIDIFFYYPISGKLCMERSVNINVCDISLDKTEITIPESNIKDIEYTFDLFTTTNNSSVNQFTFTSSNDLIVTKKSERYLEGGLAARFIALSPGTATITVTGNNDYWHYDTFEGVFTTCQVTVVRLVNNIYLNKTELSLHPGEFETISAYVSPEDASNKNIIWTSSDENIAKVVDGTIMAIDKGIATISATAVDGSNVSADCIVLVSENSGITNVTIDTNTYVKIFNLQGLLIYEGIYYEANLAPDYYIVVCGDKRIKMKIE